MGDGAASSLYVACISPCVIGSPPVFENPLTTPSESFSEGVAIFSIIYFCFSLSIWGSGCLSILPQFQRLADFNLADKPAQYGKADDQHHANNEVQLDVVASHGSNCKRYL